MFTSNRGKMVFNRRSNPKFIIDEKVVCQHKGEFYLARCIDVKKSKSNFRVSQSKKMYLQIIIMTMHKKTFSHKITYFGHWYLKTYLAVSNQLLHVLHLLYVLKYFIIFSISLTTLVGATSGTNGCRIVELSK